MKQPCPINCPNRNSECHSKCEKWLEYEKERNIGYKEKAKEKYIQGILYSIEKDRKRDVATGKMKARRNKNAFKRY